MLGEVAEVMRQICNTAAQAVYRYCEVACQIASKGAPGLFMPESFLGGYVLDKLGNSLTMSLETNYRDLEDFCRLPRNWLGGNQRIDLVVYLPSLPVKEEQGPMLLVEFKLLTSFIGDRMDREKLLKVIQLLKPPAYGAVCAVVNTNVNLAEQRAGAMADGDCWYQCDVGPLPHSVQERLFVCARLFNHL